MQRADLVIVGAGVVGLAVARAAKLRQNDLKIIIVEKESREAFHSSGRNSGVLHAGFYYTADSLKARFTVNGNAQMRAFCASHRLAINECGKLVVAQDSAQLEQLYELERRGKRNGSEIYIVDAAEAERLEPNVVTFQKALWSPRTATVDPRDVCKKLREELEAQGVHFLFEREAISLNDSQLLTSKETLGFRWLVNCAGLYADKLAHQVEVGKQYTMLPFKGLYIKYSGSSPPVKRNIYPVPNLKNPFLGVHFTITRNGTVKIGPTATPAFWREHYRGWEGFKLEESAEILRWQAELFARNSFGFRSLAIEEVKKYRREYFVAQARSLVKSFDEAGFKDFAEPGIRAQLLDRNTKSLVQDFIVEKRGNTVHVLNAVSPGFTCSFPFAEFVVENYLPLPKHQNFSEGASA